MTEVAVSKRPIRPPRVRSMVLPLIVAVLGLVVGGFTAQIAAGLLWGLIGAGGFFLALRIARMEIAPVDIGSFTLGIVISTVLATRVLPDVPDRVDVLLSVQFAAAWIPAAIAAGWVVVRKGIRPSAGVNTGLLWLFGAGIAVPAGETLGVINPTESLVRGADPVFGSGDYAIIALAIGMFGLGAMFAFLSGLSAIGTGSALAFMTVYAGAQVGFTIPGLIENITNIVNVPNFWPPDFEWAIGDGSWWWVPSWEFGDPNRANPIVETIRIAVIASVLGVGISLPLAFLASTLTAPNRPSYLIDKGFINLIRTVPDLFWAMIFVTSVGAGAFAGALALTFFSMAIMSKLLSETVDTADPGPLEAAKATGSRHFPAVRSAVLPQVLPNYVAYGLYVFEINIRASVVLGIVGAGGIGQTLEASRAFFRFDRVLAIVTVIFVIVFIIEQISIALRRRLV
jgi:phosphonate transport system permease protein